MHCLDENHRHHRWGISGAEGLTVEITVAGAPPITGRSPAFLLGNYMPSLRVEATDQIRPANATQKLRASHGLFSMSLSSLGRTREEEQ